MILPGTTPAKAAVAHALVEDLVTLTCDVGKRILNPKPKTRTPLGVSASARPKLAATQAYALCTRTHAHTHRHTRVRTHAGLDTLRHVPAVGIRGTFAEQWQMILETCSDLGRHDVMAPQSARILPREGPAPQRERGGGECGEVRDAGRMIAESEGDSRREPTSRDDSDSKDECWAPGEHGGAGIAEEGRCDSVQHKSVPGRWCCIYKDAEEVQAYEGSDLQLEVQGRKVTSKEWRAFEASIDAFLSHAQALLIQRRVRAWLAALRSQRQRRAGRELQLCVRRLQARSRLQTKRCAAVVLQAGVRQRHQFGKYSASACASRLQRAWRGRQARVVLARARRGAACLQALVRRLSWCGYHQKVFYYADCLHGRRVLPVCGADGGECWEYLATPLDFLRVRLGAGRAGSQTAFRQQCLAAFDAWRRGGQEALELLQRATRGAACRREVARRRAARVLAGGLLACTLRGRHARVLAALALQGRLRRLRCSPRGEGLIGGASASARWGSWPAYFFVASATFASRFSWQAWRVSVASVAPRVCSQAARAKFGAKRCAAAVLLAALRRSLVLEALSRERSRRAEEQAALLLVSAMRRRRAYSEVVPRWVRRLAARVLCDAAVRSHVQMCSRRWIAACLTLAAGVAARRRCRTSRARYVSMQKAALRLQAAVRRARAGGAAQRMPVTGAQASARAARFASWEQKWFPDSGRTGGSRRRPGCDVDAVEAERGTPSDGSGVASWAAEESLTHAKSRAVEVVWNAWRGHRCRAYMRRLKQQRMDAAARGVEMRLRQRRFNRLTSAAGAAVGASGGAAGGCVVEHGEATREAAAVEGEKKGQERRRNPAAVVDAASATRGEVLRASVALHHLALCSPLGRVCVCVCVCARARRRACSVCLSVCLSFCQSFFLACCLAGGLALSLPAWIPSACTHAVLREPAGRGLFPIFSGTSPSSSCKWRNRGRRRRGAQA